MSPLTTWAHEPPYNMSHLTRSIRGIWRSKWRGHVQLPISYSPYLQAPIHVMLAVKRYMISLCALNHCVLSRKNISGMMWQWHDVNMWKRGVAHYIWLCGHTLILQKQERRLMQTSCSSVWCAVYRKCQVLSNVTQHSLGHHLTTTTPPLFIS